MNTARTFTVRLSICDYPNVLEPETFDRVRAVILTYLPHGWQIIAHTAGSAILVRGVLPVPLRDDDDLCDQWRHALHADLRFELSRKPHLARAT